MAAATRFYHLGSVPVFCDEFYTWRWVSQSSLLSDIIHILVTDIYPPLYQIFTWASTRIDDSPFYLRFWSATGGVLSTWLCWSIARRRFGRVEALLAGILAALSPLAIHYAQEAKLYSFFAALCLWMLDEFLRLFEDEIRSWKWMAAAVAACFYTCYLTPYLLAALVAAALWRGWSGEASAARRAAKSLLAGTLAAAPLFPFFLKGFLIFSQSKGDALLLPWYTAQDFSVGYWIPALWAEIAATLALLGLLACWRSASQSNDRALKSIILFAVLPPLLNWLSSLKNPVYSDRALLACSYAWLMASGIGLYRLRRVGAFLLALLIGIQLFALATVSQGYRVDYRPAYEALKPQLKAGDAVFHNSIGSLYPFKYMGYLDKDPTPHWRVDAVPVLPPAAEGLRSKWRPIKAWLAAHGLEIYAGMEKSRVWSPRLEEEALKGVRRIWYVQVSSATLEGEVNYALNMTRPGIRSYDGLPADPLGERWLGENHFRFTRKTPLSPGIDAYLFERP